MLDEIVVTAQKREQDIQDVGISISAFTGEQMETLGIQSSSEIAAFVPGVHTSGALAGQNKQFTIRGVTQADFNDIVEAPNAVYLDEGYIAIAQAQTFFPTRPVPQGGSGYGAKAGADAPRAEVENEDQIQTLVRFASGAGGVIEASRVAAGKVFGVYWEVSGTKGTILMDGERFNELKIARFDDPKPDRGFKTIYAGSQVPQFGAFFGFDFAGGGLGYFDVKVIEVRDLIDGIAGDGDCFPNFAFGLANERIIDAMERSLASRAWEPAS